MQKPDKVSPDVKRQRERLGNALKKLRGKREFSLRQVAEPIGLSASNLMALESGTNVPTAQIYQKLIDILRPSPSERKKLDKLYSDLRKTPPPDVCEIILQNDGMNDVLRVLSGTKLTSKQIQELRDVLQSFRPPDKGGGESEPGALESIRPQHKKNNHKENK